MTSEEYADSLDYKAGRADTDMREYKVSVRHLDSWFGTKQALKDINFDVKQDTVTALIGPSGCGKTTLIRCLNRMNEMTASAAVKGSVLLDKVDIYDKSVDPVIIKRRMGMVFQKPNPFPTMSIYDNVAAGLKLNGIKDKRLIHEIVEESLKGAALWDEVKDELDKPGISLSGGQQQRLCKGAGDAARSATDGRADVRARPDRVVQDRGADKRPEEGLDDNHSYAQHAAGGSGFRLHRVHVPGRDDRIRADKAGV
jgi:phosphate transport system ATP-binding protein